MFTDVYLHVYICIESDDCESNLLSTGEAVAVTFVVTFLLTLTVIAIITFIVTYLYVKKKFSLSNDRSPQQNVLYEEVSPATHTITKKDLEMQKNPAYCTNVIMDTNPAYESYK